MDVLYLLAEAGFPIDFRLLLFAIVAFTLIGVGLALMILFTKAKLVSGEDCKILINDDPNLTKTSPSGETLLAALTANGIPVPSPCGGKATCKQCKVQVIEGAGPPLETDKGTFTKKELAGGWRLSCQSKINQDIHVHVDEHALNIEEITCKVVSNENVATFIKELIVEAPKEIPYKAGGYLQFHVPPFASNSSEWKKTMDERYYGDWKRFNMFDQEVDFSHLRAGEVIRAYSMASYPAEGRMIKFNIRIASPPMEGNAPSKTIPWGICSSYTFALKPGEDVVLSGPYGESFMIDDERELIFLIGGAGSSFGRSHILHLFYTEHTQRKVTMWYGARSLKENIYQEEYEALDRSHDNFTYHLVLSDPTEEDLEAGWPKEDSAKTGFVFKAFELNQLKKMEEPEEALYYVCGPPLHNQAVMKLLDDYGVPRESIILDDFGS